MDIEYILTKLDNNVLMLNTSKEDIKQRGEVFTPRIIINKMIDKIPDSIWENPNCTWLDPAVGLGQFPVCIFQRLMESLRICFPDDQERKEHILSNMIYTCELNPISCEKYKSLFGDNVKLNLFEGNSLDLQSNYIWQNGKTVESFDVIIGNPPYQGPRKDTGTPVAFRAGGGTLWNKFVVKFLGLVKPNGYLSFIHPSGWRKPNTPNSRYNGLFDLMTHTNQMIFLKIHNKSDGKSIFGAGTRFDYYIIQKKDCQETTLVIDEKGIENTINLKPLEWLANYNYKLIESLSAPRNHSRVLAKSKLRSKCKLVSDIESELFKYPLIHLTPKKGIRYKWSNIQTQEGYFGIPKVIFGDTGFISNVVVDWEGLYGLTNDAIALPIDSLEQGIHMKATLESKEFNDFLKCVWWGNFRIDWRLFMDLKDNFYDLIEM